MAASDSDSDDDVPGGSFFTLEDDRSDLATLAGHSAVTVKATPHVAAPEDRPLEFGAGPAPVREPEEHSGLIKSHLLAWNNKRQLDVIFRTHGRAVKTCWCCGRCGRRIPIPRCSGEMDLRNVFQLLKLTFSFFLRRT